MKPDRRRLAVVAGALAFATLAALVLPGLRPRNPSASMNQSDSRPATVTVRLLDEQGRVLPPAAVPRVVRTDAEWRARLTPEQYRITRRQGTEPAFCGAFFDHHRPGIYSCVGCDLPLFTSAAKFDSGTGWPSFFQPVADENVTQVEDLSYGMRRVEINCARCDAHLGHVFDDGPRPTGLRFCLNSAALAFRENRHLSDGTAHP